MQCDKDCTWSHAIAGRDVNASRASGVGGRLGPHGVRAYDVCTTTWTSPVATLILKER
jgi:hypothetical protein